MTTNCTESVSERLPFAMHFVSGRPAEREENTCREAYTPEEMVHLGGRFEEMERKAARERQAESARRNQPQARAEPKASPPEGGKLPPSEKSKPISLPLPPPPIEKSKVRDIIGKAAGVSGRTYEKAKAVVEAARAEPALRGLVDEMNRTGKVLSKKCSS